MKINNQNCCLVALNLYATGGAYDAHSGLLARIGWEGRQERTRKNKEGKGKGREGERGK